MSDGAPAPRPLPAREGPVEFVQSLERGISVITAFDRDHQELTISQVADRTGLTRAGARRFLITLRELGYVHEEERRFSLRPKVLDLGYAYLSSTPIADIASPHLREAAADLEESCSASVLDGGEIVYVARASAPHRIMSLNISIGSHLPAAFTSMGRVLLAHLPSDLLEVALDRVDYRQATAHAISDRDSLMVELERVRDQGYAMLDQEREEGVRSIAVPIRDKSGRVNAAINASAHASRVDLNTLRTVFLDRVRLAQRSIETDLAGRR